MSVNIINMQSYITSDTYTLLYEVPTGKRAKVKINYGLFSNPTDSCIGYVSIFDNSDSFITGIAIFGSAVRGGTCVDNNNGVSLSTGSLDNLVVIDDSFKMCILINESGRLDANFYSYVSDFYLNEGDKIKFKSDGAHTFYVSITVFEEDIQ